MKGINSVESQENVEPCSLKGSSLYGTPYSLMRVKCMNGIFKLVLKNS